MNVKFLINDYALIWSLLFNASISESIHKLKQKLWLNYKKEYNNSYKDKAQILTDFKNYIPNDDTIYNIILENKEYEKLAKQAEKYRLEIMKLWDSHKKEIANLFKNIIKKDLKNYNFLIVNKELNIIDSLKHTETSTSEETYIIGLPIDKKEPKKVILKILLNILEKEVKNYPLNTQDFKKAILELAVLNEFATQISNRSCYISGDPALNELKRRLYPYWLMYLGVSKADFTKYMMRDNIAFDIDKYAYEKELKKMNIEEFIDFCIRNKRYIIRTELIEVI